MRILEKKPLKIDKKKLTRIIHQKSKNLNVKCYI